MIRNPACGTPSEGRVPAFCNIEGSPSWDPSMLLGSSRNTMRTPLHRTVANQMRKTYVWILHEFSIEFTIKTKNASICEAFVGHMSWSYGTNRTRREEKNEKNARGHFVTLAAKEEKTWEKRAGTLCDSPHQRRKIEKNARGHFVTCSQLPRENLRKNARGHFVTFFSGRREPSAVSYLNIWPRPY